MSTDHNENQVPFGAGPGYENREALLRLVMREVSTPSQPQKSPGIDQALVNTDEAIRAAVESVKLAMAWQEDARIHGDKPPMKAAAEMRRLVAEKELAKLGGMMFLDASLKREQPRP